VHVLRPDLDLEGLFVLGDDGRVQGLVELGFGMARNPNRWGRVLDDASAA
jgi:hypothetical protein